jgi:type II secretory ATPase GspE/PulE/Tfp pilus assembly ATPase PilB-like protein
MAQRLARRIAPGSQKAIPMDEATKIMLEKQFADLAPEYKSKINLSGNMYEAVSSESSPSGISGRIPVFEMFKVDKEMQEIILKKPVEQEIYKLARSRGMLSIREDAIIKALKGDIPVQEVYNF